ncbi:MAG TPA: MarR family transcriptional regulator [Kofleriaceae bacterium]|nr:MarR family transcriptional regulator [Kofleriaceae bacterium]
MVDEFRSLLQEFVRQFGLLSPDRTPCGRSLALSDAHALMLLRRAGAEGLAQTLLADQLGIDKSTASRLVARMTETGHMSAAASDDGRARPVRLTKKGLRLADEIDQASRRRFAAVLERVPAERRARVVESLRDVVGALTSLKEQEGDDHR